MNNKGFGLIELLLFAALTIVVIFTAYIYFDHLVGYIIRKEYITYHDYTNPYAKYDVARVDNKVRSNSNKEISGCDYTSLEDELSSSARVYFFDNYGKLDRNDTLYVRSSTLKNYGYINNIVDSNDGSICTGYTVIDNYGDISIKSYINCPSYVTNGYDGRFN